MRRRRKSRRSKDTPGIGSRRFARAVRRARTLITEVHSHRWRCLALLPFVFQVKRSGGMTRRCGSPITKRPTLTFVPRIAPGGAFERIQTRLQAESRRNLRAFLNATKGVRLLVARPVLQRAHVQVLVVLASAHIDISVAHRDGDTLVRVLPGFSISGVPYQFACRIVLL